MRTSNLLTETLSNLSVPRGRILYIHSSMDWLIRAGIGVGEALDSLIEWTTSAGGTLVFPAFPFRGSHEAYLQSRPTLDMRRTPDADLSVIALGPQADAVVGTGLTGKDPTGPDSPFQRILGLGGALAGLGVSLNYMNMIHVLDSRYREHYPFEIYSRSVYPADTIDAFGYRHTVVKHAMLNDLQVHIKPSRIVQVLKPSRDIFRSWRIGDTDFFVWELPPWEKLCVEHIEQMLDARSFPCWLAQVEPRVPRRLPTAAEGR